MSDRAAARPREAAVGPDDVTHSPAPDRETAKARGRGQTVVLSICIPTYNRPDLVGRTIESVLRSAREHEAEVEILVSDNSPAVSENVCRRALAAWTGPAEYIGNRRDLGPVGNFNQCIRRASGRYILLVHDDDTLLPEAVPTILRHLARPDAHPVLLFGVRVVDGRGRLLRRAHVDTERDLGPPAALRRVLSDIEFVHFPAMVVRCDAYETVGLFDDRFRNATDLEMWVRLFARYGVRCLPTTTSVYTVHSGAATQALTFDPGAVATLMEIFDVARRTGVLPADELRRCQREFFHQFVLGAAYLRLQDSGQDGAREVLGLFRLPAVRQLGRSPRWFPIRLAFEALVRAPDRVVAPLVDWIEERDLVRRLRVRRRVRL